MAIPILIALSGILGGVIVNYLADVLPVRRRLTAPICLYCGEELPISKYLLLLPGCPNCGKKRSIRQWLTIIWVTAASLWLGLFSQTELPFLLGWLILIYFSVVVIIDLEHRLILNPVSLVGAFLAAGVGILLHGWRATLSGGAAGFLIMLSLYGFGILVMRFQARRRGQVLEPGEDEALGFGDVSLSAVLGLLLGWPGILIGLLLAIFIAAGASLLYMAWMILRRQYQMFAAIPYGPFLIAGAILVLFFRDAVRNFFSILM